MGYQHSLANVEWNVGRIPQSTQTKVFCLSWLQQLINELPFASQVVYRVAIECMHPEVAQNIPEALKTLLLGCWKPKPQDRPNIKEVIVALEAVIAEEEGRLIRHAQETADDGAASSATSKSTPPVQSRQTSLRGRLIPRAASEKALMRPSASSTRLVDGTSMFARVAREKRPNPFHHATSEISPF